MNIEQINEWSRVLAYISVVISFIAGTGTIWTDNIIQKRKNKVIKDLRSDIEIEKNKLRSIEVRTMVDFLSPKKGHKYSNHYVSDMKNSVYFKMGNIKWPDVTFEQVKLPDFSPKGNDVWTFTSYHQLQSSYPLNHEKEALKKYTELTLYIPFMFRNFQNPETVQLKNVFIEITINGKIEMRIDINTDFKSILKPMPTDENQGYIDFTYKIPHNDGMYSFLLP